MALIIRLLYRELLKLNGEFYKDSRVRGLPFVGSPTPTIIVVTIYMLFVQKWGPKWMEDRKPYNVKVLMQIHNVLQIVINAYACFYAIFGSHLREVFSSTCEPVNYDNNSYPKMRIIYLSYIYYLTKYLDLLDTVFFVVRKKNNQVTFLHVYHHTVMVLVGWLYMTFMAVRIFPIILNCKSLCMQMTPQFMPPDEYGSLVEEYLQNALNTIFEYYKHWKLKLNIGSYGTMLGVINVFVHMVMYTYYLVSSMDLKIDFTPWKKRITQLQILQFCYLIVYFSIPVLKKSCNDPFMFMYSFAVVQNFFMAAMFSDFYYKAYVKKRTNNKKIT